ncbi:uncharacterized protein [Musca autumnalis]|uniref:uncharacterized protein n=1 Tax=Musca autumnalis TaxID=221902 RepID=UPI003CF44CBE
MSQVFSIKAETFANDYKAEDSNNDTNTLSYNATNLENYVNVVNKMEEFLPENVDESTVAIIKEENVDEMDEFLTEDSASIYSPSSPTWQSDDRKEVITHDEVQQQHVAQQHLPGTATQQIFLPKLEIMDVHEDENEANFSANKEESVILSSRVSRTPTEHKCQLCGNSYTKKKNLQRHMRAKHPLSINDMYICEVCNRRFATQRGLENHYYQTHPETHTPTGHKCEICGSCYKESKSLRVHIRNKHPSSIDSGYICEICNKRFTTQKGLDRHSYQAHPETQTPTEHMCEICGSCFKEDSYLQKHIKDKHPLSIDTEYICEICNQKFTKQLGLDRHSYVMHPETQTRIKYECELCDCSYTDLRFLRAHIRKKHPLSIDTEYICEICHKRFTTQKGLEKHFHLSHRSTQKSAKYNCEICGRCYTDDLCHLRRHMRNKHPLSIDTDYICKICNQRFTTQNGLSRHCKKKH